MCTVLRIPDIVNLSALFNVYTNYVYVSASYPLLLTLRTLKGTVGTEQQVRIATFHTTGDVT